MKPIIPRVAIRGEQCQNQITHAESLTTPDSWMTSSTVSNATIKLGFRVEEKTNQAESKNIIITILLSFSSASLALATINLLLKLIKKFRKGQSSDQVQLQSCTNPAFELSEL
mgnify:CR=1 FL=1